MAHHRPKSKTGTTKSQSGCQIPTDSDPRFDGDHSADIVSTSFFPSKADCGRGFDTFIPRVNIDLGSEADLADSELFAFKQAGNVKSIVKVAARIIWVAVGTQMESGGG